MAAACSPLCRLITRAKANHLIMIFLSGGFSHVDTFDYKPALNLRDGQPVPSFGLRPDEIRGPPAHGLAVSLPALRRVGPLDQRAVPAPGHHGRRLCVIRTLHTDIVEHFQAVLAMHTGSATVPMPSLGAWLSYGLGTFNPALPSYVVLCEHMPYAGTQVWDSSFLPPIHQGVRIVPGPAADSRPGAAAAARRRCASWKQSCCAT